MFFSDFPVDGRVFSNVRCPIVEGHEEFERGEVRETVFDMTVADSPDEVDVARVAQPVRGVFRGRRDAFRAGQ